MHSERYAAYKALESGLLNFKKSSYYKVHQSAPFSRPLVHIWEVTGASPAKKFFHFWTMMLFSDNAIVSFVKFTCLAPSMCTVSKALPSLSAVQVMLRTWEGVAKQKGCKNRVTRLFFHTLHVLWATAVGCEPIEERFWTIIKTKSKVMFYIWLYICKFFVFNLLWPCKKIVFFFLSLANLISG